MILATFAARAMSEEINASDAVVAVVNKDVITSKEVIARAQELLASVDPAQATEQGDELRRQAYGLALRRLVDEKLLEAEAKRLSDANEGFRKYIEDRTQRRLEEERLRAGGDGALRDRVKTMDISYAEYGERIRRQIMREAVMYYFVLRDLTVAPAEILDYYRTHSEEFREPEQARCRQIFIEKKRYETRDKAAAVAQDVLEQLRKQHDFAQLAETYSDDSRAKEGGLWDWTRRGARPAEIDAALFALKPTEIAGPIETDIGFTILRMEELKPARIVPFEEVQRRIEDHLLAIKRAERSDELFRRLEKENLVNYIRPE